MIYPQPLIFKQIRHPFLTFFNPPPLGHLYFVALYILLILILLFQGSIVSGVMYYEDIAYRAAWVTLCQIPLVFLLAMKNSIVGFLVGSSHERLNWIHRTVARCLLFTVTIHFGFFYREWWIYDVIASEIVMMPIVKYGMGAWAILIWITFTSFAPIRGLRYEFFVVQHILSFVAFITCVMLHVPSYAVVYVWIAVGFYLFDRVVRTLILVYRNFGPFHRKTRRQFFSCKGTITALPGCATRITISNPPLRSWSPGQHIFLSIPRIAPFQSHPFTIASSPSAETKELVFVVRAHAGFSRKLLNRAISQLPTTSKPAKERPLVVILDGPYGHPPNYLQYDTLILVAGSTGITFTIPILLHALESSPSPCIRRIQFIWIVKEGCQFEWFASEISLALDLATQRNVDLEIQGFVTCDPSYTTNFPIRRPPSKLCGCCCSRVVEDSLTKQQDDISLTPDSSSSIGDERKNLAECQCSAGSECAVVQVDLGRPDLRGIIERDLRLARGQTGVAVCGPQGLMARTRSIVAELSDERGADKGTGAFGIELFGEGFGW
jgi:predicted ferric reductase